MSKRKAGEGPLEGEPSAKRQKKKPTKAKIKKRARKSALIKKAQALVMATSPPRFIPLTATNFVCSGQFFRRINLETLATVMGGKLPSVCQALIRL